MTDLRALLAPIRERLAAATPGPWVDGGRGYVETVTEFDLYRFDIMPETIARTELRYEDADLIANAPTDLASLLAAIEAVGGLHEKRMGKYCENGTGIYWTGEHCAECKTEWPCKTTETLAAALGSDTTNQEGNR